MQQTQSVVAQLSTSASQNGRLARIEVRTASGWSQVATAAITTDGTATIPLVATTVGTFTYRAVLPAHSGAGALVSNTRTITVIPDAVRTSPDVRPITDDEAGAITSMDPNGIIVLSQPPSSTSDITLGDILVVPPANGAPSGALVKVETLTASGGVTTITTSDASLAEAVTNVPDDAADIGLTLLTSSFVPAEGVTVIQQARSRTTSPNSGLDATIGTELKIAINRSQQFGALTLGLEGQLAVQPMVELAFDMDWGRLKSYKFGVGVKTSGSLTASVGASGSETLTVPLGGLTMIHGGSIGVVPVWIESKLEVIAEVTAEGAVRLVAEGDYEGAIMAGLTNESSNSLVPKPYASFDTDSELFMELRASGRLEKFVGVRAGIYLYSAAGLTERLGYMDEVEIQWGTETGLSCIARAGFIAELSSGTTELFEKLTGQAKEVTLSSFTNMEPDGTACGSPVLPPGAIDLSAVVDPALLACIQQAAGVGSVRYLTPEQAAAITDLNCTRRAILELSGFPALQRLNTLMLGGNQISDLTPLGELSSLETLYLDGNLISELTPLAGATNLEMLYLDGNEISNLTPLAGLTNLKNLSLTVNQISNVSPLQGLTNLTRLGLDTNQIRNVAPLAGLTNLVFLDLRYNPVENLSALQSLIDGGTVVYGP